MGCTFPVHSLYKFATQGTSYFHCVGKEVVVRTLGSSKYKKEKLNNIFKCVSYVASYTTIREKVESDVTI